MRGWRKRRRRARALRLLLAPALVALSLAAAFRGVSCVRQDGSVAAPEVVPGSFGAPTGALDVKLLDVGGDVTRRDDSLMAPFGTAILSISDEGIQIYWKKIEGASGYEVERSYEPDGGFERLAYVTKGTFNYVDGSFDHDVQTVYYRVRGLSGEDGSYAAGPWSELIQADRLESMVLSRELWYLPSGDEFPFAASYGWGDAKGVEWATSDESVATVDEHGVVTGVSAGETLLSCTSRELGQSVTARVVVDRPEQPMLDEPAPRFEQDEDGTWANPAAEEARNAVLVMAGDLMCMGPQLTTHWSEENGYEFDGCYDYVKGIFEGADLSVGNLETMVASAYPYNGESGYINGKPVCNAPARYLDALRHGGLDVLCMDNNHNADGGVRGVEMTLGQVDRYGFAHTGLFASADDERTLLVDVNGIKVGFVAYVEESCGYNGQDDAWSDEQRDVVLNWYSRERAAADIAHLRERGAEYIIGYLHWGVKNHYQPVEGQEQAAQELADLGINYIVGSHPHLVQRYERIVAANGRKVPCIYSVGDFNSYIDQVEGNLDSVLMRIRLHRTREGRVILAEDAYIPCHIYREYGDEHFVTMPLIKELNGGADTPGADEALARIAEQVGDGLEMYNPNEE